MLLTPECIFEDCSQYCSRKQFIIVFSDSFKVFCSWNSRNSVSRIFELSLYIENYGYLEDLHPMRWSYSIKHFIFRREMHWSGSKWLQDNNVKRLEKRRRSSCQCKPRQPQRKVRLFFSNWWLLDGPPKDPVGTFLLKTQIIYHMRSILYINVERNPRSKKKSGPNGFLFLGQQIRFRDFKNLNFFLQDFETIQEFTKDR